MSVFMQKVKKNTTTKLYLINDTMISEHLICFSIHLFCVFVIRPYSLQDFEPTLQFKTLPDVMGLLKTETSLRRNLINCCCQCNIRGSIKQSKAWHIAWITLNKPKLKFFQLVHLVLHSYLLSDNDVV